MFVNLISKSMDSDYQYTVHPSFAEIIKQMCPIDAKVLRTIPTKGNIPIVDYIVENREKMQYSIELSNIYLSGVPGIDIFKECSAISSLQRLGLLYIDLSSTLSDEQFYTPYLETDFFKELSRTTLCKSSSSVATLHKYLGKLTPLGQNFVATCVM